MYSVIISFKNYKRAKTQENTTFRLKASYDSMTRVWYINLELLSNVANCH